MSRALHLAFAGVVLALLSSLAAAQATPPTNADMRLVWDLTRLFPSDAAWDAERLALSAEPPKLASLKGTLGRDAAALRHALDQFSNADQRLNLETAVRRSESLKRLAVTR